MTKKIKADDQLAIFEDPKSEESSALKSWALVELFGHQRVVGLVTVEPTEFPGMIRVDVPDLLKDGKVIRAGLTRYIGKAALYGVTPIDEATVRSMLPHVDGKPSRPMQFTGREEY
jgi:hypothetical protein